MRNIFLELLWTKCSGQTSPRSFFQKFKIKPTSGSTVWNVIKFVFVVCPDQGLPSFSSGFQVQLANH